MIVLLKRIIDNPILTKSRYQICKETGIDEGYLSRCFNNKKPISEKTIEKLAKYIKKD